MLCEIGEKAEVVAIEMETWQRHHVDKVKLPD